MPELPDIVLYLESLTPRILQQPLERVRLVSPFLLRTVEPPLRAAEGRRVVSLGRLGKRLVIGLEEEMFLVLHLMIAGRLRWRDPGTAVPHKLGLAAFDFPTGTLLLTEASTKKRASMHVLRGVAALKRLDPGGLEVLDASLEEFAAALKRENRTLKRVLTDPRLLSGIGNAYSDEILHRACLSPMQRTHHLDANEVEHLHRAVVSTLQEWSDRLRAATGPDFPEKVTAFREGFAVHGRYRKPCLVCGQPIQRIVYAENECNYCATCQTGGKLLADRALSRLLRGDWPRTLEELEEMKSQRATGQTGEGRA